MDSYYESPLLSFAEKVYSSPLYMILMRCKEMYFTRLLIVKQKVSAKRMGFYILVTPEIKVNRL